MVEQARRCEGKNDHGLRHTRLWTFKRMQTKGWSVFLTQLWQRPPPRRRRCAYAATTTTIRTRKKKLVTPLLTAHTDSM